VTAAMAGPVSSPTIARHPIASRVPYTTLFRSSNAAWTIFEVPPNYDRGANALFPLPSTGRGIEGEGCQSLRRYSLLECLHVLTRSEERRVGKECSYCVAPYR